MNEIVFLLCQIQTTAGWRGVNVGHSLSPPRSFDACYGPVVFWSGSRDCLIQLVGSRHPIFDV